MSDDVPPAGNKNGKGDRQRAKALAAEAWRLREAGGTYRQIGARLGISRQTVLRYLNSTEARLVAEMTETARRVYARDLAQLEHIQEQAMIAWEASKGDGKKVRRRQVAGRPDELIAEGVKREGDAKYLDTALRAIESRRAMIEKFDLDRRLGEVEKQLATLAAAPAPGPPPRSPYRCADPPPDSGGRGLFDPDFLRDLGGETSDDRRPDDPAGPTDGDHGGL